MRAEGDLGLHLNAVGTRKPIRSTGFSQRKKTGDNIDFAPPSIKEKPKIEMRN